jgi:CheY-like chemotaxis protein
VLVVDDDAAFGRSLQRVLSREHDVSFVTTGVEALARIQAGPKPDLILCDVMMPGMTGIELYQRVLERHPELATRMVFVTGGVSGEAAETFLQRTPNGYLTKPVDILQLRALVRRFTS